MRTAFAALAALAAVSLAACSTTSDGEPTVAGSTGGGSTSSSDAATSGPTGFPSSSSSTSGSTGSSGSTSGGLTTAAATGALLTAADVAGFTATTPDDSSDPLPCEPTQPSLDERFPSVVEVNAAFEGASGNAFFGEQIQTFDSADTVAQVIAAGEKGLACGTTTSGRETTTIDGPTDLTNVAGVEVDKAEGWSITSKSANASLIIAQLGQHLVVFSFAATPDVDTDQLPDAEALVVAGLKKVAAAL